MKKPAKNGKRSRTRKETGKKEIQLSPLAYDAIGISLIALGLIVFIALLFNEGGLMARACRYLSLFLGEGSFLLPLALFFLGISTLIRLEKHKTRNAFLGTSLFLVAILSLFHLPLIKGLGMSNIWQIAKEGRGGGYIGGAFAFLLHMSFGYYGSFVVILALLFISILVTIGSPLREITQRFKKIEEPSPQLQPTGSGGVSLKTLVPAESKQSTERKFKFPSLFRRKEKVATDKKEKGEKEQKEIKVPSKAPWQLPPLDLLNKPREVGEKRLESEAKEHIAIITRTLADFNVQAEVVEVSRGPTVTRYEVRLAPGIKVNKIVSLADNLAMELAAKSVRVEAPIPNKSAIGIEVPNKVASTVYLRQLIENEQFWKNHNKLIFPLGLDVAGTPQYADLSAMPHLLVGGATGSGKSVFLSSLIASFLYKFSPDDLRMIIVDPKRVELTLFDNIPHLVEPVVREVTDVVIVLQKALREMERRYDLFAENSVRNIFGYNQRFPEAKLPYLVIVIDELADIMLTKQKAQVEAMICRLAQLARATGIHLVVATQRPSVDIITGLIKANFPSRIAFAVSTQVDSRVILDTGGAELLIGSGDMLFAPLDSPKPIRIQAPYVSEREMEKLAEFWRKQGGPTPLEEWSKPVALGELMLEEASDDELFEQAVRLVATLRQASTSMLQRKMKIGYNRAARLMEMMEERGIVGPQEGVKPREVLVTPEEVEEMFSSTTEEQE
ncbi:DNA translocase FtsK [bacterium]|nr:DNA translocase FtsK [bacterium]